ncbi:MAG: hypothetical protein M3071_16285, partial [Actinomycetota bacterium]|nr:hypothetical protein [Actinomycetota bacterium]
GRPEPPPSNTISGAELLIGALPGLLRRNAPAIGGALALLTLARWRRRRRRRRPPGTETETKTETA